MVMYKSPTGLALGNEISVADFRGRRTQRTSVN